MTDDSSLLLTPKASTPSLAATSFSADKTPLRRLVGRDETSSDIADLKHHMDKSFIALQEQSRRDVDKILGALQQESAKRTALEARFHAQLLLQSENMVAMELKLLRLEAMVERRREQQSRQPSHDNAATRRASSRSCHANNEVSNVAVISSGASLTSGVTATSLLDDDDRSDGSASSKRVTSHWFLFR